MNRDDVKRVEVASGGFPGLTVTRGEAGSRASYRGAAPRPGDLTLTLALPKGIPIAGFAVLWNVLVGFALAIEPSKFWSISPFIAVGLLLAYVAAVQSLNCLAITISGGRVRAGLGPLPVPGGFRLAVRDVRGIDVQPMPDSERPNVIGHLDLVFTTNRRQRRVQIGPPAQTERAEYIAALLREQLGLPAVDTEAGGDAGSRESIRAEDPDATETDVPAGSPIERERRGR